MDTAIFNTCISMLYVWLYISSTMLILRHNKQYRANSSWSSWACCWRRGQSDHTNRLPIARTINQDNWKEWNGKSFRTPCENILLLNICHNLSWIKYFNFNFQMQNHLKPNSSFTNSFASNLTHSQPNSWGPVKCDSHAWSMVSYRHMSSELIII